MTNPIKSMAIDMVKNNGQKFLEALEAGDGDAMKLWKTTLYASIHFLEKDEQRSEK